MERFEQKRVVIGWVLFLTLLAFFTVKTVHHHPLSEGQVCEAGSHGSQSGEDDCPICHFTLSPFVQTEPLQVPAVRTYFRIEAESYQEVSCIGTAAVVSLRAPPAVLS